MIDLDEILTLDSWVTSDQHWGELRFGRPKGSPRLMRRRWLRSVLPEDVVLHLGDLGGEGGWLHALPGRKLLILGNFDKADGEWYEAHGFEVLGRGDLPFYWNAPDGRLIAFSHEPLGQQGDEQYPFDVNIHGHIHEGPLWPGYTPSRRVNVSVDVTDFGPIRLHDALERES